MGERSADGTRRRRAAVVMAEWGAHSGEVPSAVRAVAGALALSHDVAVVSLDDRGDLRSLPPRLSEDGIFPVHSVAAAACEARLPAILTTALALGAVRGSRRAGTLPDLATRRLIGMQSRHSPEALERLDKLAPEVVVLAGVESLWIAEALPVGPDRPRVVALPLLGTDERLASDAMATLAEVADAIGAVSPAEERLLRESAGRRDPTLVKRLHVAFPVNGQASHSRLAGIASFGRYLLVISGWPEGDPSAVAGMPHDYLRSVLGPVSVAEVRKGRWLVSEEGRHFEVPWAPSRMNLWRLMAGAVATVDLRRQGPVGREAVESLAFGTPVVVPAGSVAAELAAASNGGLWYEAPGELLDQAGWLLAHEAERLAMGRAGRELVVREHGDTDRFVHECEELAGAVSPAQGTGER